MKSPSVYPAKICLTAAGVLIHDGKVLLVKHKKLQIWLNPGGHIEENEMPHRAAEREFFEETGIKVRAVMLEKLKESSDREEFLPNPILTNLHWISTKNFDERSKNPENYQKVKGWERGCEQHLNFLYIMEPVGDVKFKENIEETDGIAWFGPEEIENLETLDQIKVEIKKAFDMRDKIS